MTGRSLAISTLLEINFISIAEAGYTEGDRKRLAAVEGFVEKIQRNAASRENPTPLVGDGINVETDEVVEWVYKDGRRSKISNFASQQNYLRTLVGLSMATGDPRYEKAAEDMTRYFLENYVDENGLFYWGGHRFVDLDTGKVEGPQGKNQVHELKNHLPYIDFLYSVDGEETIRFAKQFWNAHVEDWETLDMGRHGSYSKKCTDGVFDDRVRMDVIGRNKLPKLPETKRLTFINAANDMIYFGYKLSEYTGSPEPAAWPKHLMKQYVDARNPQTGMPVYQFAAPRRRGEPPKDGDADTNSRYGDRAARQFGDIAQEGNALFANSGSVMRENAIIQLEAAKLSGDEELLFALLDLHEVSGNKGYLETARRIGDNIIRKRVVNGYFVRSRDSLYTSVNSSAALAIVSLDNALKGSYEKMPVFLSDSGYLHGEFLHEDGPLRQPRIKTYTTIKKDNGKQLSADSCFLQDEMRG